MYATLLFRPLNYPWPGEAGYEGRRKAAAAAAAAALAEEPSGTTDA